MVPLLLFTMVSPSLPAGLFPLPLFPLLPGNAVWVEDEPSVVLTALPSVAFDAELAGPISVKSTNESRPKSSDISFVGC
ncbi:hypothetical protein B0O80DRAFT_456371 [Mortierella sp. GBAus27b]|nr:hypothetical protein B0O80DRAFT_456371 [Mortierella sp. GBAus27b]